jgi:hypothetical protein
MSKKFENLDSLILGNQPDEINLDEVNMTQTDETAKSEESEKNTETKASTKEDDLIDLDLLDKEEVEVKKVETEGKKSEKTEEVEEKIENDSINQEEQNPEEVLKHWSNYFKENSILAEEDLEGFDGSMESLTKAFEKREVRTGMEMVEDYKSQLPAAVKFLADNWEEGVPLNELLNIKSNQIKYSAVTDEKLEESIDTQKMIYTEYLKKTTRHSQAKIEKEVNRLLDTEELKDEAKDALKELKIIEAEAEETLRKETKKEQEKRKEDNYKLIKTYEKASKELKEVVPGVKLTEKEQREIFDKTVNPVGVDGFGNPVNYIQSLRTEDPINFDLKINYLLKITNNLKDFSKITNTITTKATKDLSNLLNTPPPKNGKDGISTSEKKSLLDYLSMGENKKQFKKQ